MGVCNLDNKTWESLQQSNEPEVSRASSCSARALRGAEKAAGPGRAAGRSRGGGRVRGLMQLEDGCGL